METRVQTVLFVGDEAPARCVSELSAALGGTDPSLLFLFASPQHDLAAFARDAKRAWPAAHVLTASTAGEFTERGDAKGAASAVAIAGDFRVFGGIGRGLKAHPEGAVADALAALPREAAGYPHATAFLLLDPLAGNGEEVSLTMALSLGDGVRLVGGAAGDDLRMQATEVGWDETVASDALAVALLYSKAPLGIGVMHGHEALPGDHTVTRAEGGVVHTVDGRPAFDAWRDATREHASAQGMVVDDLSGEAVGAYLLRYEAGIANGSGYKVRAPLAVLPGGALQFAAGIPEGTVFRITHSTPSHQVDSAVEAARLARAQLGGRAVAGAVVFDCICRNLILGAAFKDAVTGISRALGDAPIGGFETYGEVALDRGEMSGFHNTTSVVVAFPR